MLERPRRCRSPAPFAAIAVLSLLPLGCGGPGPEPAGPSWVPPEAPSLRAPAGGARFVLHPAGAARLRFERVEAGGERLLGGDRGERWLVRAGAPAEPAGEAAPEDLVGVLGGGASPYWFVGASGALYATRSPLGPFHRGEAPREPLLRVTASPTAVLGVTRDGSLVRAEPGVTGYRAVGPTGPWFHAVVLAPDGRGLALAAPEALHVTLDDGARFAPVATPPVGAEGLTLTAEGEPLVLAATGAFRLGRAGEPPLVPVTAAPRAAPALGAPLPRGSSAEALLAGRVARSSAGLVELRAGVGERLALLVGPPGAPPHEVDVPGARGCRDGRVAALGRTVLLVCTRELGPPAVTRRFELHRSVDGAVRFEALPLVVDGRLEELRLAVGQGGDAYLSGICAPALRAPGCAPQGVYRLPAGPRPSLAPLPVPSMAGTPLALVTSLDGARLHLFARRTKGERLASYVSLDRGRTFDAQDLEGLALPGQGALDDRLPEGATATAAAGEDGAVSLVLRLPGGDRWVVVDAGGAPLGVARPPAEGLRIGAAGRRGLAVDPRSAEAFESLDGGAVFSPIGRLPVDPCGGQRSCDAAIACLDEGCLLGARATRLGWGAPPPTPWLAPPSDDRAARVEPRVNAPIVCSLAGGAPSRLGGVSDAPGAAEAMLGTVEWVALRTDPASAEVTALVSRRGSRGGPVAEPLLPPLRASRDRAIAASLQVEGVAALRYPLPGTREGCPGRLCGVEVAWVDLLAGTRGRVMLPDAGPARPGDVAPGPDGVGIARPALLSIASGGLYVTPGAAGGGGPTYFLRGGRAELVPPAGFPPGLLGRGRGERAHVDGTHLALRLDAGLVARAGRGPAGLAAVSLGFPDARALGRVQSVGIAYAGARPGLVVLHADRLGADASAALHLLRAEGAPVEAPLALPTPLDLPREPTACSDPVRAATPRLVAPSLAGTRHPVLVSDGAEPLRVFLTDAAVLHGTPAEPCVAALEAELVAVEGRRVAPGPRESALVLPGAPGRGWVFRQAAAPAGAPPVLEARAMSCHFAPDAEVPPEVFRERGTLAAPRGPRGGRAGSALWGRP